MVSTRITTSAVHVEGVSTSLISGIIAIITGDKHKPRVAANDSSFAAVAKAA